jgi:hypothetical protein
MGLPLEVEGIQLPEKRLSMRKIKEVLRLRHQVGLHQEEIARSCSIGQSTVHRYLERAEAAQLVWPLADVMDPKSWTEKWPFLRWCAALKMKESQCHERVRVTHPA